MASYRFAENPPPDFAPNEGSHRSSGSGSANSQLSVTTSANSLNQKRSHPTLAGQMTGLFANQANVRNAQSFLADGAISPLHEIHESDFQLDMNLDDMEGIVDHNLASASAAGSARPSTVTPGVSGGLTTTESTNSSLMLQTTLDLTSSFATTVSTGSAGYSPVSGPPAQTPGRSVVSEAHRQSDTGFARTNPFSPGASNGHSDAKNRTPPSPYSVSPKHSLPQNTQPRRPSQLRNVKMGSAESDTSSEIADNAALQPLAPAWASTAGSTQTVFNDPFGPPGGNRPSTQEGLSPSRSAVPSSTSTPLAPGESSFPNPVDADLKGAATGDGQSPSNAASAVAAAAAAAWAAPESWGVEGDEDPEDASSSEEEEEEGYLDDHESPLRSSPQGTPPRGTPSSNGKKPPPFGFKSATVAGPSSRGSAGRPGTAAATRGRVKTSNGRPATATRPASARPGTSGSTSVSSVPVRVFRSVGPKARNKLISCEAQHPHISQ